jgi:hypothetical protein
MRNERLIEIEPSEIEVLNEVSRLAELIRTGSEARPDTPNAPAQSLSRDALLTKAAAANQATNKINAPDRP